MNLDNILPQLRNNQLVVYWLSNAIMSLALGGVYSIILVFLRTPILVSLFSNTNIFKSALVVHVNLSILIWLLSVTASIWSYNLKPSIFSTSCVILAFIGTVLIALSPICGQNFPVMNNYIPMLENIIFILGISSFAVAILLFAIYRLYQLLFREANNSEIADSKLVKFTIFSSTVILLLIWLCFSLSYWQLQKIVRLVPVDIEFYYELLFWSGGHLLQFLYTQILILIWLILFAVRLGKDLRYKKLYYILLCLNFSIAISGILGHLLYDIIGSEFREYYTKQMQYGGGIAPVLSLIIMFYEAIISQQKLANQRNIYAKTTIICSSSLFLFGGLIGILISGINVTIPAHYHGSIVGISVAFMGFTFLFCYKNPEKSNFSLAIIILTIGQILHITALLFAGGYGVLRKTPGVEMDISGKIIMGIMGGGGVIAIIGGLLFVVICGKKMLFINKANI